MTSENISKLDQMCPIANVTGLGTHLGVGETILLGGEAIANNLLNADGTPAAGAWRYAVSGDDLVFQRYENSAWVTKSTVTAA